MAARKTKKANRSRNVRIITIWIALMAVFISELLFYTWCRVQSTQQGYAINRSTREYRQQLAFQNNLKIELVRLKSPQRIARIARGPLGLNVPQPEQVIILP